MSVLLGRPSCFLIEIASGTDEGVGEIFGSGTGFSEAALFISSFFFNKLSFSSSRRSVFWGPALRDRPALPRRMLLFNSSGATYLSVWAFLSLPNSALNSGSCSDCAPIVPLRDFNPERKSVLGVVSCFNSGDLNSPDLNSGVLKAGNLGDDEAESEACNLGGKVGTDESALGFRAAGLIGSLPVNLDESALDFEGVGLEGSWFMGVTSLVLSRRLLPNDFSALGTSFLDSSSMDAFLTGSCFFNSVFSFTLGARSSEGVEGSGRADFPTSETGLALVGGVTFLDALGECVGVFFIDDLFNSPWPKVGVS